MQIKQSKAEVFITALREKKKLLVTYYNRKHGAFLTKMCVPIQHIGPLSEHGSEYFYFWDEESDIGERLFGLPPSEIESMEQTEELFDPNNYILPYTNDI